MNNKPLKRNIALQPLSREHHFGLQLCWKIRTGLKKEIEISRIRNYVLWFYDNHLLPHFNIEETLLYPILGNDNELIKQALSEHNEIKILILSETNCEENLRLLEQALEKHIRFEERILFNEIQSIATLEQLNKIHKSHNTEKFIDNTFDAFWENNT